MGIFNRRYSKLPHGDHRRIKPDNRWADVDAPNSFERIPQDYSQGYKNPYINAPDAPVFDNASAQNSEQALREFIENNKAPQFRNRWDTKVYKPEWELLHANDSPLDNNTEYGKVLYQSGLRSNYTTFNDALSIVQSNPQTNVFFSKLKQQKEFDAYFFMLKSSGAEVDEYGFIYGLKGQTFVFENKDDWEKQFNDDKTDKKALSNILSKDFEKSFQKGKKIIAIGISSGMLDYCENTCHNSEEIQYAGIYCLAETISHECNLHGMDKLKHDKRSGKKAHQAYFNLSAESSTSPAVLHLLRANYGDGTTLAKILLNDPYFKKLKSSLIASNLIPK